MNANILSIDQTNAIITNNIFNNHNHKEESMKQDSITRFIDALFSIDEFAPKGAAADVAPAKIYRFIIDVVRDGDSFKIAKVRAHKDKYQFPDGIELRYCLDGAIPDVLEIRSYEVSARTEKIKNEFLTSVELPEILFAFLKQEGCDLYGGTSTNKGVFYGVKWPNHPFTQAADAVGYLSLPKTPISIYNGRPTFYTLNKIQVLSADEFREIGLVPGYGTAIDIKNRILPGQFRLKAGNSIGKGNIISLDSAKEIGLMLSRIDMSADIAICVDDFKINKPAPGYMSGLLGITYNNVRTVNNQNISTGFEYYQFFKPSQKLSQLFADEMNYDFDYKDIVLGMEAKRRIAAHMNNEPYEPLQISYKMIAGLLTLGPSYPAVNEFIKRQIARYLVKRPNPNATMRIAVVVEDWIAAGLKYNKKGDTIIGKYPITAGLGIVKMNDVNRRSKYWILSKSLADSLNIDGDGDGVFGVVGDAVKFAIDNNLVKPLRDINVVSRSRKRYDMTTENIAIIMSEIMANSSLIGQLTDNYYMMEVAIDNGLVDEENALELLKVYYQGIEAVIKSAKHDMTDRIMAIRNRDYETERLVRELVNTEWKLKKIKDEEFDDFAEFTKKYTISEPLHHMDYVWNANIQLANKKIAELDKMKQPLPVFSRPPYMGIADISGMDNNEIKRQFAILKALGILNSHTAPNGELHDEKIMKIFYSFVEEATKSICLAAKIQYIREYLNKTQSPTGSFVLHIDKFWEAFRTDYPAMELAETKKKTTVVRFFGKGLPKNIDFANLNELVVKNGKLFFGKYELEAEDGFDGKIPAKCTFFPYYSIKKVEREGRVSTQISSTKSVWVVF